MGQRKSKQKQTSYEVTSKDFEYSTGSDIEPIPPTAIIEVKTEETVEGIGKSKIIPDEREKEFDPKLIPTWLKEEIFVDILRENIPNFQRIKNFKAYPALGAGENYVTLMLRINIDMEMKDETQKNLTFMLKVPHDNEQMKQMQEIANFFDMENSMFLEILPKLQEICKEANIDVTFSAKAYKFKDAIANDSVLLQDLRPLGYKNANRLECLDMAHAECVLRKLAQLHAASATFVATKGPFPETLVKGVWSNDDKCQAMREAMVSSFKTAFLNNVKHFEEGQKYEPYVTSFLEKMAEEMLNLMQHDEDEFNVLNHGDCWVNNFLFKYNDKGEIEDMIFVDYQLSKYGSPAQDLLYFIFSSLHIDIKLKEFEYLIRFYYDNLIEGLKLMKYPKDLPILRDLFMQLFKYGSHAVWTTVFILPVVLLDPTDLASMDNFMSDNENGVAFKNSLFSNKRYHRHINEILPWLYNRGLLETYDCLRKKSLSTASPAEAKSAESPETVPPQTEEVEPLPPASPAIPEWINESLFEEVLLNNFKDFRAIKDFKVKPGTNCGDNYASMMLQVDIDMSLADESSKVTSFMLKVALSGKEVQAMLDEMSTFDKEIAMYNQFLPKFVKLYQDKGREDIVFGPRSFDLPKAAEKNVLLLENLRIEGFKNCDRLEGLDEDHTKAVLKKIAEFHAASAVLALEEKYPIYFMSGMYEESRREFFKKITDASFPIFNECLKDYKDQEEYGEKLQSSQDTFFDYMLKLCKIDENSFNVLNHGDLWTNNIMFKHDEQGNIDDTYLIDYQIVQFGSPAHDLYYFLLSSPAYDIKLSKFDYFVKYYHDHLVENLKLLKYPKHIPTLKELNETLLEKGAMGVGVVMGVMSAILLDPTELANMANIMSEDGAGAQLRKLMYSNARYKKHAETLFAWLNYRGALDLEKENESPLSNEENWENALLFEIPEWVNETFFEEVLKANISNFSRIGKLEKEQATKAGDNYASIVVKIDIEAEVQDGSSLTLHFMLKIPPTGEQAKFLLETWNSFEKEINLYANYIPAFEAMYKNADQEVKFSPAFFKLEEGRASSDFVLLENLQNKDFRNADRLKGLTLDETKGVLRKLAQFHAASAKFVENGNSFPEYFNDSLYNERSRAMFEQIIKGTNKVILESTPLYKGYEEYKDKLPSLLEKFLDKAIALNKIEENEFNVLNHADCWVNNIMFQYDDEGFVKETLLIDYQDCKYGPPAYDLYYFLMSSTEYEIKVDLFDFLVNYYYDNLVENLNSLAFQGKIPTLDELNKSLIKYGFFGFSTILGITTLVLLDPNEKASIETIVDESGASDELRSNMYTNPRYKAHAEMVLLWLNRRGILDD